MSYLPQILCANSG